MENEVVIYEIDPSKKYILSFPGEISNEGRQRIHEAVRAWLKGNDPFFIVPPGVKLVKVELPEERTE